MSTDLYRLHTGDPGSRGTGNLSGGDPSARPLADSWNNPTNCVEAITFVSKWQDGKFIEAKPLSVAKCWGGADTKTHPEGDVLKMTSF